MKKHYELVCVIDPRLSMDGIKAQKTAVEKHLTGMKKETDDMGLLPLAYPLKGQTQAYFVSYLLETETPALAVLKSELSLEKGVLKFHLFSLKSSDKFMKFAALKKAYADTLPVEEEETTEDEDEGVDEQTTEK